MTNQNPRNPSDDLLERIKLGKAYLLQLAESLPDSRPHREEAGQALDAVITELRNSRGERQFHINLPNLIAFFEHMEETTLGTPEARALRRLTTPEQAAAAVSRSEQHPVPLPESYWASAVGVQSVSRPVA